MKRIHHIHKLLGIISCVAAAVIVGCGGGGGDSGGSGFTATTVTTASTSGTGWTASTSSTSSTASTASTSSTAGQEPTMLAGDLVAIRGEQVPYQIYTCAPSGARSVKIVTGIFTSATVTADRKWVVLTGHPTGQEDGIYAVRPDGTDLRRIASADELGGRVPDDVTAAPEGHVVAFRQWSLVETIDIDTLQKTSLNQETPDDRAGGSGMSWSPTGQAIVYSGTEGDKLRSVSPAGSLSLLDTDGFLPSFSPDGSSLAYVRKERTDDGDLVNTVRIRNMNGGGDSKWKQVRDIASPIFDETGNYLYYSHVAPHGASGEHRVFAKASVATGNVVKDDLYSSSGILVVMAVARGN